MILNLRFASLLLHHLRSSFLSASSPSLTHRCCSKNYRCAEIAP
uniref:Uncharacterized protein n=1 Tax=Rhizophora mucronata TaxID=61149 RepID=A0A2P2QK63_RHIMU